MNLQSARFVPPARQAYPLAHEEAVRQGHRGVGPAHLLDALSRQADTGVSRLLLETGVAPATLRRIAAELLGEQAGPRNGFALELPALRRAFEAAVQEAEGLGHDAVETGHLLLGLLALGGPLAEALDGVGLSPEVVRDAVRDRARDLTEREVVLRELEEGRAVCEQRYGVRIVPRALVVLAEQELRRGGGAQHRARRALHRLAQQAQTANLAALPKDLRDIQQAINELNRQKEAAVTDQDFELAAALRDRADRLTRRLREDLLWARQRDDRLTPVVDEADVVVAGV